MILKNPQAVIFDFDGVIADSVSVKTQGFLEVFKEYGEHLDEIKTYLAHSGGISRFVRFKHIYENILTKGELISSDLTKRYAEDLSKFCLTRVIESSLMPGVLDFVFMLKKRGVDTFIVSATPDEEIKIICEKKEISDHFEGVYGSPRFKDDIIEDIIRENNYEKSRVYYIGDSVEDLKFSKSAGVNFIGYRLKGAEYSSVDDFSKIKI